MWKWLLGGGLVGWVLLGSRQSNAQSKQSAPSNPSSENQQVGDGIGNDPLFEAFWQVVGREESWCLWDKWTANDAGSGVSIGWIQFNQKSGLLHLLNVAKTDTARFAHAFGGYTANFANPQWVKSADLNQATYKQLLLNFLRSDYGKAAQRMAAYTYYWMPVQDIIDVAQPNASDAYRVLAGSVAVQFGRDKWQPWIEQHSTLDGLNNAARDWLLAHGFTVGAKHRIPRQRQNAYAAVNGTFRCR